MTYWLMKKISAIPMAARIKKLITADPIFFPKLYPSFLEAFVHFIPCRVSLFTCFPHIFRQYSCFPFFQFFTLKYNLLLLVLSVQRQIFLCKQKNRLPYDINSYKRRFFTEFLLLLKSFFLLFILYFFLHSFLPKFQPVHHRFQRKLFSLLRH